jgi:hypothetical protein
MSPKAYSYSGEHDEPTTSRRYSTNQDASCVLVGHHLSIAQSVYSTAQGKETGMRERKGGGALVKDYPSKPEGRGTATRGERTQAGDPRGRGDARTRGLPGKTRTAGSAEARVTLPCPPALRPPPPRGGRNKPKYKYLGRQRRPQGRAAGALKEKKKEEEKKSSGPEHAQRPAAELEEVPGWNKSRHQTA